MSGWFYGLVKENDGKLRIWEISRTNVKKKTILWGHRGFVSWMIQDIVILFKDLYGQWKYMKKLWYEKDFEEGNKEISKYWESLIKQIIKKDNKGKKNKNDKN